MTGILPRLFTHCLLRPEDLDPSRPELKVIGAFNPGGVALADGSGMILLLRVAEQIVEEREGHEASPRITPDGDLHVDWLDKDDLDLTDPRNCWSKDRSSVRLRFISHLRVVRLAPDGVTIVDLDGPRIMPADEFETYGIEDPRITRIDDTYYITYVGVSRHGAATRLISTKDFINFDRHGTIFAPDNKDVSLFPERINDKYIAIHRPMPSIPFQGPQMWLATSPDLIHWGEHQPLLGGNCSAFTERVGGGAPPLPTPRGWLTIYHGSTRGEGVAGVYRGGLMLLDHDNPGHLLANADHPFMEPEKDFEQKGFVDHVVFPTAAIPLNDQILIYYGAADERVGVTAYPLDTLLAAV